MYMYMYVMPSKLGKQTDKPHEKVHKGR